MCTIFWFAMVCSIGSERMAAITRILTAGSISQTITEDAGHKKMVARYIYNELCEADEANLLDEDDMHVFDLKPMTDPLNLVCCNACKKPVKVSQFAAHAEICKSLSSTEEIVLKACNAGRKKTPRKERKKSSKVYAVQQTLIRDRGSLETAGGHEPALSSSHLNGQLQPTHSNPLVAKGSTLFVDRSHIVDGSDITPEHVNDSAGAVAPPTKRSKLISADSLLISDHIETANGVTKSTFINTQEAFTCGAYPNGLKVGCSKTSDHVVGYQMPCQVHERYIQTRDVPAPLATKIYYSQRDHLIRSAISNLYQASTNGC